jgi:hypothetical protein
MPRTTSPKAKPAGANGQAKLLQSENNLLLPRHLPGHGRVPSRKLWAKGASVFGLRFSLWRRKGS